MNHLTKKESIIILILIIIIAVEGIILFTHKQPDPEISLSNSKSVQQPGVAPIKLLSTEISPDMLVLGKVKAQDMMLCQSQPTEFMNENDTTEDLGSGYKMLVRKFQCTTGSGPSDYTLEITNNSSRHALYTYVLGWKLSEDKKSLFLVNYVKDQNGDYERRTRMIDIASKKTLATLPHLPCTSSPYLHGNYIDTNSTDSTREYTEVCRFDTQGNLLGRVEARLRWSGSCCGGIEDDYGFLPNDPNIFYAVSNDVESGEKSCFLYLQDVKDQTRNKKIKIMELTEEQWRCRNITVDLSKFDYSTQGVTFKVETDN